MKISLPLGLALFLIAAVMPLRAQEEAEPAAEKKSIYIPSSPRAADYVLGRLSNKELVELPRQEVVFMAFLKRKGLAAKYREEALTELAKLHKTDRITELLAALERNDEKGDDASPASMDLGKLISKSKPEEITAKKAGFEELLDKARQAATREAVYAALISISGGKSDELWAKASKDNDHLSAIVGALPLVADADVRAVFESRIAPLAKEAPSPEIQQRAIAALPSIKGSEAANFGILAELIASGKERDDAVEAMLHLPVKTWPKDQASVAAKSIVTAANNTPAAKRTEKSFLEMVKLGDELASILPSDEGKAIRKALGGLTVRVVVLKTIHEQMLYDKARIVIEAGKPVEIDFENPDAMPHNVVITAPDAREDVAKLAEKMQPTPDDRGLTYVPKSPKVLFATKLIEAGQRAKLSFTAPKTPGDYEYVCTFPGHYVRMFGKLVVTDDVEKYIAEHPEQEVKMTEWKLDDFSDADFSKMTGANAGAGKPFFTALGCIACHKIGDEGTVFGPELTEVFKKWKNDPKAVLEQILDPSKVIDDAFRSWTLELSDDSTVAGFIKSEKDGVVTVVAAPGAPPTEIKAATIKSRTKAETSTMPPGLLNALTKEQILDLLAYLKSGGKVEPHKH